MTKRGRPDLSNVPFSYMQDVRVNLSNLNGSMHIADDEMWQVADAYADKQTPIQCATILVQWRFTKATTMDFPALD